MRLEKPKTLHFLQGFLFQLGFSCQIPVSVINLFFERFQPRFQGAVFCGKRNKLLILFAHQQRKDVLFGGQLFWFFLLNFPFAGQQPVGVHIYEPQKD